jgi:hypothetical protein
VEQKNGAVVRRTIGYRRFEGLEAAAALARLYAAMRLFVNFFQPSFKLAAKARDGLWSESAITPRRQRVNDVGGRADERGGATPRERAARHVGPSSSAAANSCGPAAAHRYRG